MLNKMTLFKELLYKVTAAQSRIDVQIRVKMIRRENHHNPGRSTADGKVAPKRYVHVTQPVNVTLLGKRVFPEVVKLRISK